MSCSSYQIKNLKYISLCFILVYILTANYSYSQEKTVPTPPAVTARSVLQKKLNFLSLTPEEITIPVNILNRNPDYPLTALPVLQKPCRHFLKLEQSSISNRSLLPALGWQQQKLALFLEEQLRVLKHNTPLVQKFLKTYPAASIIKLITENRIPGPDKAIKIASQYKRLRRYLKQENNHYKGERFYSNFYKLQRSLQRKAWLPLLPADTAALVSAVTNLELPLIIGSSNNDIVNVKNKSAVYYDPGGDDLYRFRSRPDPGTVIIVLDCRGNDLYTASGGGIAFSFFSMALVFDLGGNDVYREENLGLAAAAGGYALLYDKSGNDIYQASQYAQAYAFSGTALLYDAAGEDRYLLGSHGQGLAGVEGMALLYDCKGDDLYYARGGAADNLRYENRTLSFAQGA
ncbi:MAG TPA: hypothetical protein VKS21_03410, partial [Spirochaetota bacterium]|nr:hypothetical protein [Spirochaetota bacterium]